MSARVLRVWRARAVPGYRVVTIRIDVLGDTVSSASDNALAVRRRAARRISPRAEGTPLYVYSAGTIAARYRAIDDAFRGVSARAPLRAQGQLDARDRAAAARRSAAGADANSGGEIDVALRAGFIPEQIVFTGVGKTPAELAQAIDLGVKTINAESEGELERIDRARARARQTRARVALRVNPDIDARSHPHISTGLKTNKFGIALDAVRDICRRVAAARRRSRSSACTSTSARRSPISSRSAAPPQAIVDARARAARRRDRHRSPRSRRRPRRLVRRHRRCRPPTDYAARCCPSSATPAWRSSSSRAATSSRPPARCCRASSTSRIGPDGKVFVDPRRRHDRVDAADALRRLPPHRAGRPRRRVRDRRRHRRAALREQRHARQGPPPAAAARSAICSPFSTPAPTARSWPPTTTAARCRPKCWSTDGQWSVDPPPPDDRRPARARELMTSDDDRRLLIAFEGLDQSGKQTQAERVREHVDRARARLPPAVVPRLHDADRRRDRARRCTASATTAPTSCSCSTSPTATSSGPR